MAALKSQRRKHKAQHKPSSGGGIAVDLLGDRWSLLILRDIVLRNFRSFKELLESGHGIATNILANRLRKLVDNGLINVEPEPSDRRKLVYSPTAKGTDLTCVLTEMARWTARHADRSTD